MTIGKYMKRRILLLRRRKQFWMQIRPIWGDSSTSSRVFIKFNGTSSHLMKIQLRKRFLPKTFPSCNLYRCRIPNPVKTSLFLIALFTFEPARKASENGESGSFTDIGSRPLFPLGNIEAVCVQLLMMLLLSVGKPNTVSMFWKMFPTLVEFHSGSSKQ
jgi:hypothetical protein